MDWLDESGLVIPISNSNKEWSTSPRGLQAFDDGRKQIVAPQGIQGWLENELLSGGHMTAKAVDELGVERIEVTETLGILRRLEKARIDPDGPQRGPTTRWISWSMEELFQTTEPVITWSLYAYSP